MKKRVLLAAAAGPLAALVMMGTVMASAPGPAYLVVQSFGAVSRTHNAVTLSATTGASIPRQPDAFINSHLIVRLAWADLDNGTAFVTTIHPVIGRDSHQNPDSWHAHTATVSGGRPHRTTSASCLSTPRPPPASRSTGTR